MSTRQRFHSERAAHFKQHASNTKKLDTREMYLRLAEAEMALVAKEDKTIEEPGQQIPKQAKAYAVSERANDT